VTTFDEIHTNAEGYRKDYTELKKLCLQLAEEKAKGNPVVSWFRLRRRRIAQVLDPMRAEIESRIRAETQQIEKSDKGLSNVKRANQAVQSSQFARAQKIIDESADITGDIKLHYSGEAIDQIAFVESELKKARHNSASNINYLNKTLQHVDYTKELFNSTQRAKDIDHSAFDSAINTINHRKSVLDIDVPYLKEVPPTYDNKVVQSVHDEIRSVVQRIDGRYPMRLFSAALRINRIVIHDVGNDRGSRAFTNRANEIDANVNESIDAFNTKYWQITGQRWERIGTNKHGYRHVAATHPKVKSL